LHLLELDEKKKQTNNIKLRPRIKTVLRHVVGFVLV